MPDFDQDKPAGTQKLRLSDDDIRNNNYALQDAIGRDHKFPTTYATDAVEHTRVKFTAPIVSPSSAANKCYLFPKDADSKVELHWLDEDGNELQVTSKGGFKSVLFGAPLAVDPSSAANKCTLYPKDVSGKVELHFIDEDGNVIQLTSAGAINLATPTGSVPSGTKMLVYADTAPSGWTVDSSVIDVVAGLKGGTYYTTGGAVAGSAWGAGTTHLHTYSTVISHAHTVSHGTSAGSGAIDGAARAAAASVNTSTTGSASANTANAVIPSTWRPRTAVFILCTKN